MSKKNIWDSLNLDTPPESIKKFLEDEYSNLEEKTNGKLSIEITLDFINNYDTNIDNIIRFYKFFIVENKSGYRIKFFTLTNANTINEYPLYLDDIYDKERNNIVITNKDELKNEIDKTLSSSIVVIKIQEMYHMFD